MHRPFSALSRSGLELDALQGLRASGLQYLPKSSDAQGGVGKTSHNISDPAERTELDHAVLAGGQGFKNHELKP